MGRTKEVPENIERQVIYNYLELKQGLTTAGQEYGLSQYMVEKILRKYGVKKRTYTESKQESRKYSCNDDYFKMQSPNMAYILGLIASDGSVSKKENLIAIQLLESDKSILEEIRGETQSERPLAMYTRKNTGHIVATFRVWSKSWKDDLTHYGIVPNKTFILKPPELLKPEYRIDFIRGYFDGDGSIYQVPSQNKLGVDIVGASKEMIEWIHNELVNHYHLMLPRPTTEVLNNGTVMYKVRTNSKEEVKKIYELFYSNGGLCMQRKKRKFETLLNIPRDSNSLDEE